MDTWVRRKGSLRLVNSYFSFSFDHYFYLVVDINTIFLNPLYFPRDCWKRFEFRTLKCWDWTGGPRLTLSLVLRRVSRRTRWSSSTHRTNDLFSVSPFREPRPVSNHISRILSRVGIPLDPYIVIVPGQGLVTSVSRSPIEGKVYSGRETSRIPVHSVLLSE